MDNLSELRGKEKKIYELSEEKKILLEDKAKKEDIERNLTIQNKALSVTLGQIQNEQQVHGKISKNIEKTISFVDQVISFISKESSVDLFLNNLKEAEELPTSKEIKKSINFQKMMNYLFG
jgi:hypothetical protein